MGWNAFCPKQCINKSFPDLHNYWSLELNWSKWPDLVFWNPLELSLWPRILVTVTKFDKSLALRQSCSSVLSLSFDYPGCQEQGDIHTSACILSINIIA
jgi:hypothetical protein